MEWSLAILLSREVPYVRYWTCALSQSKLADLIHWNKWPLRLPTSCDSMSLQIKHWCPSQSLKRSSQMIVGSWRSYFCFYFWSCVAGCIHWPLSEGQLLRTSVCPTSSCWSTAFARTTAASRTMTYSLYEGRSFGLGNPLCSCYCISRWQQALSFAKLILFWTQRLLRSSESALFWGSYPGNYIKINYNKQAIVTYLNLSVEGMFNPAGGTWVSLSSAEPLFRGTFGPFWLLSIQLPACGTWVMKNDLLMSLPLLSSPLNCNPMPLAPRLVDGTAVFSFSFCFLVIVGKYFFLAWN